MTHMPSGDRSPGSPTLLGIDLGTSSVKALITDLEGDVVAQATGDYAVRSSRPGWSETDPQEWWAATITAVRAAVAQADVNVVAIGFSGQMHGVVVADRTGVPLRAAMLWSDSRATAELAIYRDLPDDVRARLANPLSPGMAGPLLAWLSRNEPDIYAATAWALSPKDWLRSKLTGTFHAEPSDASATLLYDVTRDSWDQQLLDALGLDAGKLAPLLAASSCRAGELTSAAAQMLGLTAGIPVAAGAGDAAAGALGAGLVDPGTAQLTIGTGAQLVRPVGELPRRLSPAPVTHLYRAATDAGWYSMAASLNGGSTLTWVRRVLGASWEEVYASAARPPRDDDPFFLPHLHGERTPYLDPDMRAAWTGLGPRHQRDDLLHAALEGVAFAVRESMDSLLTEPLAVPELRLAGGGTAGAAWRRMLADVLEFPVTPIDVSAASALGAAMLAGRVSGMARGNGRRTSSQPTTYPDPERSRCYRRRYDTYRRHVAGLRSPAPGIPPATAGRLPSDADAVPCGP